MSKQIEEFQVSARRPIAQRGAITLIWCSLATLMMGCSLTSAPRVDVEREKTPGLKERPLGVITFANMQGEYNRNLRVKKIRKGYALSGNMHESEKSRSEMVISKDKRKDWFAGIQMKWSF